ncbi:hypothetical protein PPGU16_84690 (plasmid) [Paraburkholderia largidicola]|uniref:Uncharacterized protein n=1 Tax=Paraburkholderia largidicola TaxID=3014751 RepID=A0A7I8C2Z4_9BURK|nr:hypothetical protein PPGU16_84690 [Paraburkholderia sp. PGU16]
MKGEFYATLLWQAAMTFAESETFKALLHHVFDPLATFLM